jgi:hypothetical protein
MAAAPGGRFRQTGASATSEKAELAEVHPRVVGDHLGLANGDGLA